MDLGLMDEAVDVGDPDVGLALVIQQVDLELVAIDAAGRVDGLELVLDHLAVFLAILRQHAHGHADADGSFGAFIRNDRAAEARNLERVFDFFPVLKERRRQRAATLSGGELQMLCIGRGLMSEPKMIMLDEPSSALAPQVVLDIFHIVSRICKEGMTMLLVEQNVRMALLLAEYGYVIKDGIIHMEGLARDLIDDDNLRLSYLGGAVAKGDPAVTI